MTIRMSTKAALAVIFAIGSMQPLAAQRVARGPQFHRNTQKYSDVGAKPVGGRSGSASLQARAMLSEDGTVLVEASTGDLDAGTAPGQIRKMQMKVLSPSGKPGSTQNFEGRGDGYWSASVPRLGADGRVQLQANIGGIDGKRTDVVTVSVPVKRRPDVAVNGVAAPARALAGVPMNVVATVSERNGDMGARANCMLQVDGQLSDQARGIWIDAGQTVSCAFQTQVATVGSHKVTVYVTGISPADWDGSDNSASTSVDVLSPETALSYSASFTATDADYVAHTKNSSDDGSYVDENTQTGKRQERLFSITSWTTANSFSFPTRVRSALLADGVSVFDYSNDIALQPGASSPTADCGELIDGRFYLSVCNLRIGSPHSEVSVSSFDGRVTYFGSHFIQFEGEDTYIPSSSDTPTGLGAYPVSSSVQLVIELRDARGMLFAARPTMSLLSTPINESYGSCFRNPYNQMTYCADGTTTGTTRTGAANDGSQQ
jgi:hypothetical protein